MEEKLRLPDLRQPKVEAIICSHLGSSPGSLGWSNEIWTFAGYWGFWIVQADTDPLRPFGVSADTEKVENIARAVRSLTGAIERLPLSVQRNIELAKGLSGHRNLNHGPHGYTPVIGSTKAELQRLAEALDRYIRWEKKSPRASGKRNWRAASVASVARQAWAAAHWELGERPAISSELHERYRRHLEEYAPRTAALGGPGPFGRFLEDVNAALGICKTSGEPISARTALDSLKALQGRTSRTAKEKSSSS